MKQVLVVNLGSLGRSASFRGCIPMPGTLNLTRVYRFHTDPEVFWEFFGLKKMKHGNHGKKLFIVPNTFFWWVSVLKKSQKNYFGGRFSPTLGAEKWCLAL
jgi:hypothetical protein